MRSVSPRYHIERIIRCLVGAYPEARTITEIQNVVALENDGSFNNRLTKDWLNLLIKLGIVRRGMIWSRNGRRMNTIGYAIIDSGTHSIQRLKNHFQTIKKEVNNMEEEQVQTTESVVESEVVAEQPVEEVVAETEETVIDENSQSEGEVKQEEVVSEETVATTEAQTESQ